MQVLERDTAWTRTYGGSSADGAQALLQTRDGGLLLAGYTFSFGSAYANAYLVRTDASGNLLWSNAYGGPGWEYLYWGAGDRRWWFCSRRLHHLHRGGGMDMYLLRVDTQGSLLWERTFGGAGIDVARGVAVDPQGDLILAGYTNSSGAGENDVYIVKTDRGGQ